MFIFPSSRTGYAANCKLLRRIGRCYLVPLAILGPSKDKKQTTNLSDELYIYNIYRCLKVRAIQIMIDDAGDDAAAADDDDDDDDHDYYLTKTMMMI